MSLVPLQAAPPPFVSIPLFPLRLFLWLLSVWTTSLGMFMAVQVLFSVVALDPSWCPRLVVGFHLLWSFPVSIRHPTSFWARIGSMLVLQHWHPWASWIHLLLRSRNFLRVILGLEVQIIPLVCINRSIYGFVINWYYIVNGYVPDSSVVRESIGPTAPSLSSDQSMSGVKCDDVIDNVIGNKNSFAQSQPDIDLAVGMLHHPPCILLRIISSFLPYALISLSDYVPTSCPLLHDVSKSICYVWCTILMFVVLCCH